MGQIRFPSLHGLSPIYFGHDLSDRMDWYITKYQIQDLHKEGINGEGVCLFVLDSGMSKHEDLSVSSQVDFTEEGLKNNHFHGDWVGGIAAARGNNKGIIGVTPKVQLISCKVLRSNGMGSDRFLIKALEFVLNYETDQRKVVNMSLGGGAYNKGVEKIVNQCLESKIAIVAAVGNDGISDAHIDYPARYEGVIGVGATDKRGAVASFSSRGNGDVVAPGVEVTGCHPNNGYISASGSSGSSPFIAALVAMAFQVNPTISLEEVKKALVDSASDSGAKGFDKEYFWGVVNPKKFISLVKPIREIQGNTVEITENRIQLYFKDGFDVKKV